MSIDLRLLVTLWYFQPFLICTCSIVMLKHKFISKWSRIPTFVIIVEKSQHVQILRNYAYLRHRKFTGCQYCYWTPDECQNWVLNNENNLLEDWILRNGLNSLRNHCTVLWAPSNVYGNARANSTNDQVRSDHPGATTPRQDRYILRQHMSTRSTRPTETAQQNRQLTTTKDQLVTTLSDVDWSPVILNFVVRSEDPYLWFVIFKKFNSGRQNWRHQQWRNIISDKSWYCISNADDRTMGCRMCDERYAPCNMERGSWATARTIDQVLRPHVCHLLHVIGTTLSNIPVLSLQGQQYVNFPQQDNIEVNSWPALSSGLYPIADLWDEIQRRLKVHYNLLP